MQDLDLRGIILKMVILTTLLVFVFGTIIGSFLNVLVLRYNTGLFKKHRSECFSCSHLLGFYDLIPVLSFFLLKGKCRYCKSRISFQYPLVEFFTGLIYTLIYFKIGQIDLVFLFYLLVWAIFTAIFVYDLKHKIIPDGLVYTLIFLSLIKILPDIFYSINFSDISLNLVWLILAGPISAAPLAFLWLVSRGRWMGFGDVKLTLATGWLLGPSGALGSLIFAFWIGAIVGLSLIFFSKLKMSPLSSLFKNLTIKSEIPFAPFIIIGVAIVFFLEVKILELSLF